MPDLRRGGWGRVFEEGRKRSPWNPAWNLLTFGISSGLKSWARISASGTASLIGRSA